MQQTYLHPWYEQQDLLASTTTSESESTQKPSRVTTGPKFIRSIEWAAGLFEGEGCLTYKNKGFWELKIQMTDLDTLQDFWHAIGCVGNLSPLQKSPCRPDHYKPVATWSTCSRDMIFEVVILLYPHLGERRRQKVKEFLAWYATK